MSFQEHVGSAVANCWWNTWKFIRSFKLDALNKIFEKEEYPILLKLWILKILQKNSLI